LASLGELIVRNPAREQEANQCPYFLNQLTLVRDKIRQND